MKVELVVTGPFAVNAYVLDAPDGGWAVVDPGAPDPVLDAAIAARSERPGQIWLTHGHFDHIGGLSATMARAPGIDVFVHPADLSWMLDPANSWPPEYPPVAGIGDGDCVFREIGNGDELALGDTRFRVVTTPGHSPGGVVYWSPSLGWAFVGDTLFRGSIGRTDFHGGSMRELLRSIHNRMADLPGSTRIFPGHGPETTMAVERNTNPFLTRQIEEIEEEFP